jgi:hypothetical protein
MFRRTQTSLLSVMAGILFAAGALLPTGASAASAYGLPPADALAILLMSSGSLLVLLGFGGRLFMPQRDQFSVPEYPTPVRVPSFESFTAVRPPNMRGGFDAPAGPDSYGIRLATRQARPGIGGSVGDRHAAPPLLNPDRNRTPTWTGVAREPQRLAEAAVE